MEMITSADFQRHAGRYQDRALIEPVLVGFKGRKRIVLLSADEYHRLKRLDRQTLSASDLTDDDLALIASSAVPAEYACLDDELRS